MKKDHTKRKVGDKWEVTFHARYFTREYDSKDVANKVVDADKVLS